MQHGFISTEERTKKLSNRLNFPEAKMSNLIRTSAAKPKLSFAGARLSEEIQCGMPKDATSPTTLFHFQQKTHVRKTLKLMLGLIQEKELECWTIKITLSLSGSWLSIKMIAMEWRSTQPYIWE